MKDAVLELRQSRRADGKLRVLGLSQPRYLIGYRILDQVTLLSRFRRCLEDGPLSGDVALDALLLPQDWARPELFNPQVIIYAGDVSATLSDAGNEFWTTDPTVVLFARAAPEEFRRHLVGHRAGQTVHLFGDEFVALCSRLQEQVRCLCLPEPRPFDISYFQRHLAGRVDSLLLWPQDGSSWGDERPSRVPLALALFCEALALGAAPGDALARTDEALGGTAGLRLVPLSSRPAGEGTDHAGSP